MASITEPSDHGPAEPWLTCLAPLIVFQVAGSLEPTATAGGLPGSLGIPSAAYPIVYSLRLVATLVLIVRIWPNVRTWIGRPTWWPPLLGLLLVVPWVVLARLQLDAGWTFGAARAGYDPFLPEHLGPGTSRAWAFLGVRALGMVVVVPIIEELFVRGFLMRYAIREQFWQVPFGTLSVTAAAACCLYAVTTHPGEAVAAIAWFAVVSGVAAATRKPVDCILCHAATNLALGGYVLATGEWWLV
ncbi:MAG: CAAX prenyl protease-related protein [Planctomycetes bacterium]|nr:CAAX prenyl protease-related protein [Planctomycetota bacterium]